ncbi:hypothetical protein [Nocardioides sp. CFH 31398]|uniref:hypothetical protein n=1 Tax=Nocardioides sp. CFH 31398 TaxID=2919579 RepID=UPI001F06143E|nr:hypothetical protein [Nocardioides sp. CFH 31398]MCH1866020.1 hypothetical protein [Nocardioides sp. CFH 31398]
MLRSRLLRALGVVVLLLVAAVFALHAAVRLPDASGQASALVAGGLLACGVCGLARLVVDVRPAAPAAAPGRWDGEPALVLGRDPRPTQVSSWGLALLGLAVLLGAVPAVLAGEWVLAVLLALAGGCCVWSGSPHRRDLAGGVWLTPTRIAHSYRGRRWTLGWEELRDVVDTPGGGPADTDRLLLLTDPGAVHGEERFGPPGRAWRGGVRLDDRGPAGVLGLELEGLAPSAPELADLVRRAAADPVLRQSLGRA